ncbi:hypothetical protein ACIB24_19035 [Spongisporangium articulatum]|uniref:Dolichyl-phosphate-mannose-protein mannosyltransferase n=1 Tax=Spongisporangium articulatum TaxID=3362603 RepID=A0ABW8AS45_9ACTN
MVLLSPVDIGTKRVPGDLETVTPGPGSGSRRGWGRRWAADLALALVALAYGLSQLAERRVGLGWDESIYFSQVTPHEPAAFFSAPRARGISWLAAPLAQATTDVGALRIYLTVLSSIALYLAFRAWFRVIPVPAVVFSASAFGSLWVTRFYGAQLMPNLWVAFGALAAVGGFMRLTGNRRDLLGLVALPTGLAVAALMRPTDAAYVALGLLLCAVLVRPWRRDLPLVGLTIAGAALGAIPWVVEAEARFGGVAERLRQGSAIQGGLGWAPQVFTQHLRTLDGPLLCRPCTPPADAPFDTVWLLLIPATVLVLVLVRVVLHERVPAGAFVALVTGTAVGVPYLLLIGYSAPRFLLPALALLSPAVGTAMLTLLAPLAWRGPSVRRAAPAAGIVLVAALAGAQIVAQQRVFAAEVHSSAHSAQAYTDLGRILGADGLRSPCIVSGTRSPQIAFATGCSSRNVGGHDASITSAGLLAAARHEPAVAVVQPGQVPAAHLRHWLRRDVSVPGHAGVWQVYTPAGSSLVRSP